MKQYHEALEAVLKYGSFKSAARRGLPGTISLFGHQSRYDLQEGFPIVTTKYVPFRQVAIELMWFLSGSTNIQPLLSKKVNIWNEDAYNYYVKLCVETGHSFTNFNTFIEKCKNYNDSTLPGYCFGDCGHQYGALWREWNLEGGTIDQIKQLVRGLLKTPTSRRHILNAWNPNTLEQMALHPCHAFVQFNCRPLTLKQRVLLAEKETEGAGTMLQSYIIGVSEEEGAQNITAALDAFKVPAYFLDCQMYQRSADMFLGVPYNISSYALLTHILADTCNMLPGEFIHTIGDAHIYGNHLDQVKIQLERDPEKYKLPELEISPKFTEMNRFVKDIHIEKISAEPFWLRGYESYGRLPGKLNTGLTQKLRDNEKQ